MTESTRILVGILASGDAVFVPLRDFSRPGGPNRYFARRDYPRSGVPWSSGAVTEAGRKAVQRELEALTADGLVRVFRPRKSKTLAVKLSDEAEFQTRAVCGLPGLCGAWWTMHELAKRSKRKPKLMTHRWVAERFLIGRVRSSERAREAVLTENMLLPALVRGYVDSAASIDRRVSYMVTPVGWAWLDRTPEPPPDDDTPDVDAEAAQHYMDQLQAASARLDSAPPVTDREIAPLPLPCSIGGLAI